MNEFVKNVIFGYRYFWKKADGELCVRISYETAEGHKKQMDMIKNDPSIVSCYREYLNEVHVAFIGFTENVKLEEEKEKGEEENEKV